MIIIDGIDSSDISDSSDSSNKKILHTGDTYGHNPELLKKIVKILETRLQSSKSAPNWTKNCKIHDVGKKYIGVRFSIVVCVPC